MHGQSEATRGEAAQSERTAAFERLQQECPLRGLSQIDFLAFSEKIEWSCERAADIYVACACVMAIPGSAELLMQRHQRSVQQSLGRMKLTNEQFEEAYATFLRIVLIGEASTPAIATYKALGSLDGWMRVTATRAAHRVLRGRQPEAIALSDRSIDQGVWHSAEHDALRREFRERFTASMTHSFATLSSQDRRALRQHYQDKLSIDVLAQVWNLHRASAARRIAGARTRLRKQVLASLESDMGLSPSSAIRMIANNISGLGFENGLIPATLESKDKENP